MIGIEMHVAECVNEFAGFQICDLSDHHREEGVTGEVEGDTEKNIRTTLINLAAEFSISDIKLKQCMARW